MHTSKIRIGYPMNTIAYIHRHPNPLHRRRPPTIHLLPHHHLLTFWGGRAKRVRDESVGRVSCCATAPRIPSLGKTKGRSVKDPLVDEACPCSPRNGAVHVEKPFATNRSRSRSFALLVIFLALSCLLMKTTMEGLVHYRADPSKLVR